MSAKERLNLYDRLLIATYSNVSVYHMYKF